MKSVESRRTKWEKTIKGRLEDYFADEHKTIAAAVNRGSVDNAVDNCQHALMVLEQQGTLKNLMVSLYQDVGTDSGESVIKDLKYGEKPFEQKQIGIDFNLYSPDVLVYLLTMAGTKVQQIDSVTLALLQSELADGVEAGESIAQLSQRVDDLYLAEIIPNRSQVISSTEVVAASNWGSQEAAKASDLSLDKVWLATNDGHTRPDHREADGQTVGMDEPFEVGGEQLMYPGDISLGAGADQIVNCFPGDTEVVARGIQAATKRWYEGELVEITTSLGHKLAGTPNHPILTNRGWIGLGSLKEGDSVVSGRFAQEMPLSNPYIKTTPTEIGKVFDAISRFEPGERVSGSHVDFHGDGSNADVEIVFPYSLLRNTVDDASFRKPLDKELLPISDFGQVSLFGKRLSDTPFLGCQHSFSSGVRCTCERNSLVTVGLAHAQVHTFGAIAGSDTGNLQMPGNHMAGNIEPACNSFDGHTALKESNSLVSDIGMAGMSSSNALILEDSASGILNPGIGGAVRDVENISNVVEAFPGLVQLTGITKVIRRAFSGHVYNLQTKSNWYISNGIISHNCRCTTYYQQKPDSSLDETDIGKALAQVARSFPQVAPTRDQYRELLRAKR